MKNKSLILSLLLVPFLANCNKTSYTVNAQEMHDALTMKGVTYLQMIGSGNYYAFTPTSYHYWVDEPGDPEEDPYYLEMVLIEDGATKIEYKRDDKDAPFVFVPFEEDKFRTISDFIEESLSFLADKEYEDFKYNENEKEYNIDTVDKEYETYHNAIRFLNKKVDYFYSWKDGETREDGYHYSFTYEKIEPPSPPPALE